MYTAELLKDQASITKITEDWENLHRTSSTKTVFQTPAFQSIWWETLGVGERIIITVRDNHGRLVALAPIFLHEESGVVELSLLGCVNVSDYLDILIDSSKESNFGSIYEALFAEIEKLAWDKLFWCSLPEKSLTRSYLKKFFAEKNSFEESIQDAVPIIKLPSSWEEYLSFVGRKQRHEIRRKQRKLDEAEHEYAVIENPSESDVEDFISLHKQSSRDKKDFWDEKHLMFFKKLIPSLAEENRIKLFFLSVEKSRVASMLAFDEPGSLALYNSGFSSGTHDKLSVGSNLIAYTIKYAIDHNKQIYDFLRGDEAYKFRFGAVSTNIYDIEVVRA